MKKPTKNIFILFAALSVVLGAFFISRPQVEVVKADEVAISNSKENLNSDIESKASLQSNNLGAECEERFESIKKGLSALDKIEFWTKQNNLPGPVWSDEKRRYVIVDHAYASYDRDALEAMSESGDGTASILLGLDILRNEVYLWKGTGKERARVVDAAAFADGVEYLQRAASLGEHGAYSQLGYAHYRHSIEFRTRFKRTGEVDASEQERRHRLESISWYILASEHDIAPQRLQALAELKSTLRPSPEEMAAARLLAAAESAKSSGYHVDISPAENAEIYKALEFDVGDIRAYMDCSKSKVNPSRSN